MENIKVDLRFDEFGIQKCPQELWDITPKHPKWQSRVKFEIEQVLQLHNHYKKVGNREWIKLAPSDNPKYNFMIWKGQVWVPDQPEIRFDFRILLTSEYPKVMPRWYIDQQVLNYCGRIYAKSIWKDPDTGQSYVMPSNDHVVMFAPASALSKGDLCIAHHVILQIFIWWAAQQNVIIQQFELRKM